MLHRVAVVARIGEHPLAFAGQPARLELEGLLERLGVLEATGVLLLILRERADDGVAEHQDQADVRDRRADAIGPVGVKDVVRARLARDRAAARPAAPAPGREVRAVPAQAPLMVDIEVVDAFRRRRADHLRVLLQIPVERRRAAPLGADDEEVGQRPRAGVHHPGADERRLRRVGHGLGHA